MKKNLPLFKTAILSLFLLFTLGKTYASHIAGAEITYQHLSGNQFQVNLSLFVDCMGFDPGAAQTISLASTCGPTTSMTVNIINPGGTEVSQICPAQIGNTTCSGGSLPGMWIFNYTGVITLSPVCDTWTMSWTTCCRNGAVININNPASFGTYVETTLNSLTDSTNNSPYFTSQIIPYVCAGQPVNYNLGVVEPDGDSLHFSLISAEDAGGTPLVYAAGYSGISPIPGIVIDPATGMISFTPSTLGTFVVVVLVQDFNGAGNLVGSVMRDIQFQVMSCSNNAPSAIAGNITNFSGTAIQTGPASINMCPGNNFAFDLVYSDADPADSLAYQSNINAVLPGAIVSTSGANPLTLHVSWTAPLSTADGSIVVTMDITDDGCPVIGMQSFAYNILINGSTYASPDQTICGLTSATLNVVGGNSFLWTVISGPPMILGTNFSCDTCASPVASPTATTMYQVTSNLSGGCNNMDTVVVYVVPGFSYNATAVAPSNCVSQPVQLNISGLSASTGYTYQWFPAAYLNNSTLENPVATIPSAGTYIYYVTVTSPAGCSIQDTVQINVMPFVAPQPFITASDTSVCSGTTIQLATSFGSGIPASCGLTPAACTALTTSTVGTGTGSNTSSAYPAPYGNWYTSVRQQYLYTAAELNAAGITGGKIDQLDFNVTAISGISSYLNYSISIGCTGLSDFNPSATAFEGGLYNVFPSQTYVVNTGWNAHPFTGTFEWDGISNIIIEVCMDQHNPGTSYTNNSISPNDPTSYISCLYSLSDAQNECSSPTHFFQTASNHPQIRLHHCIGSVDSTNYVYSWTPSGGITSPSSQITNAMITSPQTYTITVTDTVSGCFSSASQVISLDGVNMAIKGYVNHGGLPVEGYAKLFSYAYGVQMPMQDSVAITLGNYIFSNVTPGDYIIQATADSILYPLAFPTYYDTVVNWDSADIVSMIMCNDTVTADISMLSHPSLTGTNVLSGTIIEGTGYVHSAGMPLAGINVILYNNSTGLPVLFTRSDNGGIYRFNNVPSGCYRIYVDIPGLPMDSTYAPCVTANDTLSDLHFIADANSIFITNSALSIDEIITGNVNMNAYPNPTSGYSIIEYDLHEGGLVNLEIINSVGQQISTLVNEHKMKGNHKVDFNAGSLGCSPGIYLLKLQVNGKTTTQRIILTK
jgi:hypothetical protein